MTTDVVPVFDPSRLSMARVLAGLGKSDLGRAIDRSGGTVTQYELGQTVPTAETLQRCARALGVQVGFFAAGRPRLRLDTTDIHFRTTSGAASRLRWMAGVELLWELIDQVGRVVELPPVDVGLALGVRHGDPITTAHLLRKAWGLDSGPVVHLLRQLETRGVFARLLPHRDQSGGSFSSAPHGLPIIVLADDDAVERRFRTAHEVGHLLLHPEPAPGNARHEAEADSFAEEFLMPASEILDLVPGKADVKALRDVAAGYGVSPAALLRRTNSAGIHSTTAMRKIMADIVVEAGEPTRSAYPGERPELLAQAVAFAGQLGLPTSRLAAELRVTPTLLRELLNLPDTRPRLSVVS
ncbi:helix-turn-helix domain-containing protein [Umezawaea tangerina]|uniref:Zn-dependent peptidase ImmA (M78 family) n=1 Tax=Umezawaea tangerina TaxID=84725 RepID=A0A2T0SSL2_9PSEU|nr:XRE family transcriptional regulator [Umezawaea tangerina]PRY36388.1 Zn-dependent peptidase ImmA (M78 family) [Umezawaea tangerina]